MNTLSCRDLIAGMPLTFQTEAAADLTAVIHFKITGDEPGDYCLHIAEGQCTFSEEIADAPTLTITAPSDIWKAISVGK